MFEFGACLTLQLLCMRVCVRARTSRQASERVASGCLFDQRNYGFATITTSVDSHGFCSAKSIDRAFVVTSVSV